MDVVLTGRGRELLALGELDFAYYAFFDDGIDYDPWSTGSLTDAERDEAIHSTPMFEAPLVPVRRSAVVPFEPSSFVFKAAPDYGSVPRVVQPNPTGSAAVLRCDQVSSGSSFIRTGTSLAVVPLELSAEVVASEGFSIHFYSSGSNGLSELHPRVDLSGRRVLDPFVAISLDAEVPQDMPDPSIPGSTRIGGKQ